MANYKRKKSRKDVRCVNCTDGRQGNSMADGYGRSPKVLISRLKSKLAIDEYLASLVVDNKLAKTHGNYRPDEEDE